MKVFVDDRRKAPDGWYPVRTNAEAIRLLATGYVEEISLDHDIMLPAYSENGLPVLGAVADRCAEETFMPIAYYLALMSQKPRVLFHSGNMSMAQRMAEIVGCRFDYWWPEDAAREM